MYRRLAAAAFAATAIVSCTACARHNGSLRTSVAASLSPSAGRGRAIYAMQCAACHGGAGGGTQIGPSLRGIGARHTLAQIVDAIDDPTPPMPKLAPAQISEHDVADVAAYVERL